MFKHVTALVAIAGLAVAPLARAQQPVVMVDVTPEQRAYEGRTDAQIRSWVHENNKATTAEERTFIDEHWKRAARIWRIRRLAEDAKDQATITRCEALIARADHVLESQLRRFRDRAPIMTVAPEVEATIAPPPPQVETQPPQPAPNQVWVPGYWAWNGGRHMWMGGHWTAPPQTGMAWDQPRWENRAGKWAFTEGRWRNAPTAATVVYEPPPAPTAEIVVQVAPPPPIVEVRPAGPANAVWIPGYWHWSGSRHVWVAGRWSAPRAGFAWEPDHWQHAANGWHHVQGHWRH